jgi:hypothetical protein
VNRRSGVVLSDDVRYPGSGLQHEQVSHVNVRLFA